MIGRQNPNDSAITVEGVAYVIKVGGVHRPPGRLQPVDWYVVAFTREHGWGHVPLAGPFETKAEAAAALKSYLAQAGYAAKAGESIRAFRAAN